MPLATRELGRRWSLGSAGSKHFAIYELLLFGLDAFGLYLMFLTHSLPSLYNISHSPKFLVEWMHLNILLGKCLPQISDLIFFLRNQDKNEAHGTVRPKVIPTVH